ncbi:4686_t:CDS:2, partial [Funneliformis caledonium]
LRKNLFANVVLSGGSTLYKDFGTRLLSEIRKLAVKDIKIKIFAPSERKYSTWIGSSILAALNDYSIEDVLKVDENEIIGKPLLVFD